MSSQYVLITVVICALCTQVTRWLPFLVFGRKKELPRFGTLSRSRFFRQLLWRCWWFILPEGNYTPSLPVWPAGAS